MKRGVKISLIAVAVVLIAAVAAFGWLFSKAVPIGTGYVAKYLCSSTFISNRNPDIVFEEDVSPVNPLAKIVNYKIGMYSAVLEPARGSFLKVDFPAATGPSGSFPWPVALWPESPSGSPVASRGSWIGTGVTMPGTKWVTVPICTGWKSIPVIMLWSATCNGW